MESNTFNVQKKGPVFLFVILLFVPMVLGFFSSNQSVSEIENRTLNQAPSFPTSLIDLMAFTRRADSFVKDQIVIRPLGVKVLNFFLFKFRRPNTIELVYGKEGWIFGNFKNVLKEYKGKEFKKEIQESNLIQFVRNLNQRITNKYSIPFYFCIAPDKHYVYHQYLPDYFPDKSNRRKGLNEIEKQLLRNDIAYIDIEDKISMASKKSKSLLYYKTDSHWNTEGAFIAYKAIMGNFKKQFPELKILKEKELNYKIHFPKMDFNKMIGTFEGAVEKEEIKYLANNFPKEIQYLNEETKEFTTDKPDIPLSGLVQISRIITTENNGPTLLLIRDSFSNQLIPLFEHSFSKIIVINHRYGKWKKSILKEHEIDLVLFQIVQRNLNRTFSIQ